MSDWRWHDPEVRPYFGEQEAAVGAPMPPREHTARRGTIEQLRQWRISEGQCARASCSGTLDSEGACPMCGWSVTEEKLRDRLARKERTPESRDDYVETLAGALLLGIEEKK